MIYFYSYYIWKYFNFYGYDIIGPFLNLGTSQVYFVSEEGSQVVFGYSSLSINEGLPPIFANPLSKTPLSDCRKLKYNGSLTEYFLYCNIKKDEVSDCGKLTFMANNFSKSENGLGLVNNNFNNDRNSLNQNEEIKYYKNKYNEIEMKLKIIKESFQNILMRVTIPKKDKKEIKQILKLCDFSEDEILVIVGDKKKWNVNNKILFFH